MYRYRENNGVSRQSIDAIKHVVKVGKPNSIVGYRYRGRYNTSHIGVMVKGDKGSARFSGFSWGYGGEGCRALQKLFAHLNVPESEVQTVMTMPWPNFNGPNEKFWEIKV